MVQVKKPVPFLFIMRIYQKENLNYKFSDGFVTNEQVKILKTELEKNNFKIIKT